MTLHSGHCHYHPERLGLGICVECRNVICQECTTQFEGINRCATCLGKQLAQARTLPQRNDWSAVNMLFALMSIAGLFGSFYAIAALLRR